MNKYNSQPLNQQLKLKVCGITHKKEVLSLDNLGVHYAGVWYGIPNGKYNLSAHELRLLINVHTRSLKFILVTLEKSFQTIYSLIKDTPIYGIQFHGFQLPSLVKEIKSRFSDQVKIFKVLHIQNNGCLESGFIDRYIEAGVDYFILDNYQSRERIGSTGKEVDIRFLDHFIAEKLDRKKVMLAGGINEYNIARLSHLIKPFGFDIDSSARTGGRIKAKRVFCILNNLHSINKEVTYAR